MSEEEDVMKDLEDLDKEVNKPAPKTRRRRSKKTTAKKEDAVDEVKTSSRKPRAVTKKALTEDKVETEKEPPVEKNEEPTVETEVVTNTVKPAPDVRSGLDSAALPDAVKEAVEEKEEVKSKELPPVWVPEEATKSDKPKDKKTKPTSRRQRSLASRYNRRRR